MKIRGSFNEKRKYDRLNNKVRNVKLISICIVIRFKITLLYNIQEKKSK